MMTPGKKNMMSDSQATADKVTAFWQWFRGCSDRLQDAVSQSDYDWLVKNLGAEISKLKPDKPGINWEAHKSD